MRLPFVFLGTMIEFLKALFQQKIPAHIERDYHRILTQYSNCYRQLNPELQQLFRRRIFALLNTIAFRSGQGIQRVTREMRTVIACAIVEITFGLKRFLPSRFRTVVVLPRRYLYPGFGQPFLGHTDPSANLVYFSWEDVKHGYLQPDDAVNVALHEMAHVLEHENAYRDIYGKFFRTTDWQRWGKLAFEKMQKIRAGQHEFLKSYGGINMGEMFAVCVETFFEQPAEFKQHLPILYRNMTKLLNQDPLQEGNPLLL